jgi:hypothetical protein
LVKDTVTVTDLASITSAADTSWNTATIGTAGTNLALTGLVDGSYTLYTADAAGNLSAGSGTKVLVDTTAPTLTITDNATGMARVGIDVLYTFNFSEAVTGFDASDVIISSGTKGTFTTVSSTQYTLSVSPTSNTTIFMNVATGAATDAAGNASTAATQHEQTYGYPAGQTTIDLGSAGILRYGNFVENDWYYYWDRSGDGTSAGDEFTHDELDALFNKDYSGNVNTTVANADGQFGTTNTYRFAIINGIHLALPTLNGNQAAPAETFPNGTNAQTGSTSTYDGSLAIWDINNQNGTGPGDNGLPYKWTGGNYWTSTPASGGHYNMSYTNGGVGGSPDINAGYVALQVL